jgi:hypothetical protein
MTSPKAPVELSIAKPPTPNGWKWFMRFSGVLAMALFLLPTFYAVKYFGFDARREAELAGRVAPDDVAGRTGQHPANEAAKWSAVDSAAFRDANPDDIPLLVSIARNDPDTSLRLTAIAALGRWLSHLAINFQRPVETMQAKSALADLAVHDSDARISEAAQDAVGEIAEGGVVVRR